MAFLIAIQCLLLAVVTWAAMKFRAQAPINTENAGKDIWSRRRKFFLTVWSLPFIMLKPIEARLKPIAIGNKPNIILISIDTLRADGLGTYGNPRNTSPWIDSLAADGLVLPNALSQSSWTLPSHASMLTALQPIEHGCRGLESNALPKHIHTLSEHLVNDGYKTYAVVSNILVSGAYGLDQGFDHFVTLPGGTNSDKVVNTVLTELPNKKWTIHISCLCM